MEAVRLPGKEHIYAHVDWRGIGEWIDSVSNFSDSDRFSSYPPPIHGALISSSPPPPLPFVPSSSHGGYVYQGGYTNYQQPGYPSRQKA